jgi:hypothetical protein
MNVQNKPPPLIPRRGFLVSSFLPLIMVYRERLVRGSSW